MQSNIGAASCLSADPTPLPGPARCEQPSSTAPRPAFVSARARGASAVVGTHFLGAAPITHGSGPQSKQREAERVGTSGQCAPLADPARVGEGVGRAVAFGVCGELLIPCPIVLTRHRLLNDVKA